MRDVDPFDYWQSHSSAIAGLGGAERSPDPRYLFHTRYHEVRAGRAQFVLKLNEVRASFGELAVRVHAWKPESDSSVSLVSGARMQLDGKEGPEFTLPVHFASQKGVLYALYGYLSEDSDVTAQKLHVAIDEPVETGDLIPEPTRSILAFDQRPEETRPANALLHYGRAETGYPVSQSCTLEHVADLGFLKAGFLGRDRVADADTAIALWSETLCLNALETYGVAVSGLEGLLVGPFSAGYAQTLVGSASVTRVDGGPAPPRTSGDFYDFLLMPGGISVATDAPADARERWATIEDWLARLKIGGLAMLGLRYRPDDDLISSSAAVDTETLSRNEIGQWSLRLIGAGYSVAPMAFAPVSDLVIDSQGLAGFLLIVQRL